MAIDSLLNAVPNSELTITSTSLLTHLPSTPPASLLGGSQSTSCEYDCPTGLSFAARVRAGAPPRLALPVLRSLLLMSFRSKVCTGNVLSVVFLGSVLLSLLLLLTSPSALLLLLRCLAVAAGVRLRRVFDCFGFCSGERACVEH